MDCIALWQLMGHPEGMNGPLPLDHCVIAY